MGEKMGGMHTLTEIQLQNFNEEKRLPEESITGKKITEVLSVPCYRCIITTRVPKNSPFYSPTWKE